MAETTGSFRAWVANGGKKKLAAHGATSVGTIAAFVTFMQLNPAVVPGYAAGQQTNVTVDTLVPVVATLTANQANTEKRLDKVDEKLDKLLDLTIQSMSQQKIAPRIEKEIIIDHYPVPINDRVSKAFWKRGAAADTLMVPQYIVEDSL